MGARQHRTKKCGIIFGDMNSPRFLFPLLLSTFLLGSCVPPSDSASSSSDESNSEDSSVPLPSSEESSLSSEDASVPSSEKTTEETSFPSSEIPSSEEGRFYTITFGSTRYTGGDAFTEDSYSSDVSVSISGSNCYSGGLGSSVRVGSGSRSGSLSFDLGESIQGMDIYSYAYGDPYSLTVTSGSTNFTSGVFSSTELEETPTYSVNFSSPVTSFSVEGSVRFLLASIRLYPSRSGSIDASSSEESSSSEDSSDSSSVDTSISEPIGDYYSGINWSLSGASLKTALCNRISSGYVTKSYDFAYDAYPSTDTDEDGKIIDMYSSYRYSPTSDHQGAPGKGNYNAEGQMFNREHTIPQSVFNERSPMKSDLHHLLPTDAYVNNRRSNYPHAYVGSNIRYTSTNGTIVGSGDSSKNSGYSGNACEVPDEYKGDIARIYFYFVTRYQNELTGWETYSAFTKTTYPSLSSWAIAVYLEWNDLDPISEKEIERNNAVYEYQKNRNPFVDVPGLAHKIWSVN